MNKSSKFKKGLPFWGGFLGWVLISLLVFHILSGSWVTMIFFVVYFLPATGVVLLVLALIKRTRRVAAGIASAMLLNALTSLILGTYAPVYVFAPVLHPDVYRARHNFVYKPRDIHSDGVSLPCPALEKLELPGSVFRRIVFVSYRDGNAEIYLMNADGSAEINLTRNPAADTFPAWSPDGRRIAYVAERDGNREIYLMDILGAENANLTNHPANDTLPAWSPDGEWIAFLSDRDGDNEIYIMQADGAEPTNLTNHPGAEGSFAWSPDGGQLVFQSERDGNIDLYRMNRDGSGLARLTLNPLGDYAPAWSPDGGQIVYHAHGKEGEPTDIYRIGADGSAPLRLTDNPVQEINPSWSPDGTCIIFQASDREIMVMRPDGSNQVRLVEGGREPDWSPDGRQIVYGWSEIFLLNPSTFYGIQLTNKPVFARETDPHWQP